MHCIWDLILKKTKEDNLYKQRYGESKTLEMEKSMYSKHKDDIPYNTVNRIKDALGKIELFMEADVKKHMDGIFSIDLSHKLGMWNVAGKGTTEDYCMASAYGEAIEHLCNHYAFNINELDKEIHKKYGFMRYPDEMLRSISEVLSLAPDVFVDMCERTSYTEKDIDKIEKVWQSVLGNTMTTYVPYLNVDSGQISYLPDEILAKMCGSNGGGCGNTPAEALGHALDEVIERNSKYHIFFDKLTPPSIPMDYIKERSYDLFDLINRIEKTGKVKVIVKDASLGKNYSVVCVLIVDVKTQKYLVNFGAHPCFEIALERCLTEMFQDHRLSQNLMNRDEMMSWNNLTDDDIFDLSNWVPLLVDDIGYLPNSFFGEKPSWEFSEWETFENYTNEFGVKRQLDILKKNGLKVYIRNNSFLDMPVYKVYVPTFSISHLIFDENMAKAQTLCDKLEEMFPRDSFVVNENEILDFLFSKNQFLGQLRLSRLGRCNIDLIHAALLFDTGKINDAVNCLKENTDIIAKLLLKYIDLCETGIDRSDKRHLIGFFFGEEYKDVIEFFEEKKAFNLVSTVLYSKGLLPLPSWSQLDAVMKERELLYVRLKGRMVQTSDSREKYSINGLI